MNWRRKLQVRLRALFQKRKLDAEMDEEIRSHLQMQTQENIEAGMNPEEARYASLRQFGWAESIKATCLEQRGVSWIENFAQYVRFGARMLRKNPGFTAVAVLTLALGIGANTTIFSVVNAALLRSLPFPHTSRIVYISSRSTLFDFPNMGVSLPDIDDLRTGAKSFEAVAAYRTARKELAGDGQPERIESAEISPDMLPILGIRPLYGRGFTSSDMQPGTRAVMIGYSLWRDRFGSDPNAVGKTLMVD